MGKGIGILVNDGYAYKVLAPSAAFYDSLLDLTTFGGDSAYQVWLDEGNTGTTTDFLASVGGLVLGEVMATYDIDNMSANKTFIYTDGILTSITLNVDGVDKYEITFGYDVNDRLATKLITRSDALTVLATFGYDVDGVLISKTIT